MEFRLIKFAMIFLASFSILSSCKKNEVTLLTQEVNSNTSYRLNAVYFTDDSTGYVCGGDEYTIGIFMRSTDAGRTWSKPDSLFNAAAYCMFFFSAKQGIVAGNVSDWAITADSGKTFAASQSDYLPINAIACIDQQHIVKVGGGGFVNGTLGYSNNGGQSWSDTTYSTAMMAVTCSDANTVFASGFGVVYKSDNAGASFYPLSVKGDIFSSLSFPTATTGYIAGYEGLILKTTDKGKSFSTVRKGNVPFGKRVNFNAIRFIDENNGAVAGDNGIMFLTHDGGGSWTLVKQFTSVKLRAVYLFSATSGIVVGDNGKIFLFRE